MGKWWPSGGLTQATRSAVGTPWHQTRSPAGGSGPAASSFLLATARTRPVALRSCKPSWQLGWPLTLPADACTTSRSTHWCVSGARRARDVPHMAPTRTSHAGAQIGADRSGTDQLPAGVARGHRDREKAALLPHYRFVLALENTIAPDYVTEKVHYARTRKRHWPPPPDLGAAKRPERAAESRQVWDALAGGAVPVYAGAPNVHEHLPHPQAALLVDLADPASAVAAIRALDADPAQAAPLFQWRLQQAPDIVPRFRARLAALDAASRPETPCGLCERLWRTRHHRAIG